MKSNMYRFVLLALLLTPASLFAINDLVAKVPGNSTQYAASIKNVVLVTEPHGAYVEQSLYLEYTDNGVFSGSKNVEIIHRFELPEGSVINDLWLWMGNNVMRALMLDTWKARSIYDSIVSMKRDPAFLAKKGNQYELHVYPLESGSTRKIKINFITPTKWTGENAASELPLKFLNASASTTMPVKVLFRYRNDIWGIPKFLEAPSVTWTQLSDTLGYKFKLGSIPNTKVLQSFNLIFITAFNNGLFFSNSLIPRDQNYFQIGIRPAIAFDVAKADTISKKVMVGIDLSGSYYKDYAKLIPNLKNALKTGIRTQDKFNIMVAGPGKIKSLTPDWQPFRSGLIDTVLDNFAASTFGDSIKASSIPNIVYCDSYAATIWGFSDIASYASTQTFPAITDALSAFSKAQVAAAYQHGYEVPIPQSATAAVFSSLDSLFLRGGRFLSYYDKNRIAYEVIAKHYIPTIGIQYNTTSTITLYRNPSGNIGNYFPESIDHAGSYFFSFDDPSVKKELVDASGNACVISKKLGNGGLLVITGIWPFNDDDALKKVLAIPLLGLNSNPRNNVLELKNMLSTIALKHQSSPIDNVLLFSNSDSLVSTAGTAAWAGTLLNNFKGNPPVIKAVNLVDGSALNPASITVNGKEFYGSGYLLQKAADTTGGFELESHLTDWPGILARLNPSALPVIDSITLATTFSGPTDSLRELREVNKDRSDVARPLFFLGATNSVNKMTIAADIWLHGTPGPKHASFSFDFSEDTLGTNGVNAAMLGNEKLKDLMVGAKWDTASIVSKALQFHLLCDYTALIALEPNDTIKYMVNPFDESKIVPSLVEDDRRTDSLSLSIFPNPFNISAVVSAHIPHMSNISITVYNILGREVAHLVSDQTVSGKISVSWNGRDDRNSVVSSGVYLISINGKEMSSGKSFRLIKKAILMK
jgi:hypothetical protein